MVGGYEFLFGKDSWDVFSDLEKKLNLDPYFTKFRFDKRPDGYYCVKNEKYKPGLILGVEKLDCMPRKDS